MNHSFPEMKMAKFSTSYRSQSLQAMHATNPEPFSQIELEQVLDRPFSSILQNINLGFNADEGAKKLRGLLAKNLYESINPDEVITHAGGQEALFCAFNAVLKADDKVLIVAPVYDALASIPDNIGCQVDHIHLNQKTDWQLDLDELERRFKKGYQMFVINFPHNPTGALINKIELNAIIKLCQKYNVWLLSDEVFRGLEHSKNDRLPAVADLYDKGISIGVISKAFAVPGLRVGWLVCKNQQLIKKVLSIKGYISICNSQVDEALTSEVIYCHEKVLERNLSIIRKNKDLLKNISSICDYDLRIFIPSAGCCCFAEIINGENVQKGPSSEGLVNSLATNYRYFLHPSSVFTTEIQGVRMGFGSRLFKGFAEHFIHKEKLL